MLTPPFGSADNRLGSIPMPTSYYYLNHELSGILDRAPSVILRTLLSLCLRVSAKLYDEDGEGKLEKCSLNTQDEVLRFSQRLHYPVGVSRRCRTGALFFSQQMPHLLKNICTSATPSYSTPLHVFFSVPRRTFFSSAYLLN